ncbi:T-box transcription factor TBX6 [Elysia marginata]|uniref:T-box transcription factor TBX6 n=1 Tax=Elysia marginata TaxID=1093978 RepID=A0AAV4HGM8_9GAST|nr:T-box transcription factor TBX6 [Elysia marginata]
MSGVFIHSIQNILHNDTYSGCLRAAISSTPCITTTTLTSSQSDTLDMSPPNGINCKPDHITNPVDHHRSNKRDGAREIDEEKSRGQGPFPYRSNPTHQDKKPGRSRPDEPYAPIWFLKNWAGPTAAVLRKEACNSDTSAGNGKSVPLLNSHHHRKCKEKDIKRKCYQHMPNVETRKKEFEEQDVLSKPVGKVSSTRLEMRTANPIWSFNGLNTKEVSTNVPQSSRGFNYEVPLSKKKYVHSILNTQNLTSPNIYTMESKIFDVNRTEHSTPLHHNASYVGEETYYKAICPNNATKYSTCQFPEEKNACSSEMLQCYYFKPYTEDVPSNTIEQQRVNAETRAFIFPSYTYQPQTLPQKEDRQTQSSYHKDIVTKPPPWPCLRVQLEKSSMPVLEPDATEQGQQHQSIGTDSILWNTRAAQNKEIIKKRHSVSDSQQGQNSPTNNFNRDKLPFDFDDPESSNHELNMVDERQGPGTPRYRVDESLTRNLCQTKEGVTVTLLNSALWKAFSAVGTEMIINRSGRRMFPYLALSVSGLSPDALYRVSLQILPASSRRFKYITNRWLPVGIADTEPQQDPYVHTDSLSSGDQLNKIKLIFSKVKLTNNKDSADYNILLHSMHKYRIVTTFTEVETVSSSTNQPADHRGHCLSFHFPETDFIAVTAYQNEAVTQMKIHNNPFAKAFRDANFAAFRRGVTPRRKRQSLSPHNVKPIKRANLSQHAARQNSFMTISGPPASDVAYQLRMSPDHQAKPGPDTHMLVPGLLASREAALTIGAGPGLDVDGKDRATAAAAAVVECGHDPQGSPFSSSSASFISPPPSYFVTPAASPWMSLYSNLVRSHLLQFQYLHVNAIAATSQPDIITTTTTTTNSTVAATTKTTTATITTTKPPTSEDDVTSRPVLLDSPDTPYLQMVPFEALNPSTSGTAGYCTGKRLTQPIPPVSDVRCFDPQQFILSPLKSAGPDKSHI